MSPAGSKPWTTGLRRLALTLSLVSCTSSELETFSDEGRACAVPAAAGEFEEGREYAYAEGDSLDVLVEAPGACLATGCHEILEATCQVIVEGDTIHIHSEFRQEREEQLQCKSDCVRASARCSSPALAAGRYTLSFGGAATALEIPDTRTPPCLEA